jgi:hypothetical protein
MFRIGIACVLLLAVSDGALAEKPAERGGYLVNTIMACGNCHTPRDADGRAIAEKAFSGGLTFTTPAFIASAPNITPDAETGGVSDFRGGLGGRTFPAHLSDRQAASPPTSPHIRPPGSARLDRCRNHQRHYPGHSARWTRPQAADGLRRYAGLKAADLADIIAYLRTVPPLQ